MLHKSHWRQLLAALFANLPSFTYGIAIGWTSIILPRLQTDDSPLGVRLTLDEVSWVGSIYLLSGCCSSMMYGWMADRFGRKLTILAAAASQLACWIIIEFGTNVTTLLVARFLVGFGAAGSYVTVPMFVTEISSPEIRGSLGALIIVMVNLGLVVGYAMNSYLHYYTVPYILIAIFVIFYAGYAYTPETPKFYAMKADFVNAKRSLQYYRGYARGDTKFSGDFDVELELLRSLNSCTGGATKVKWQEFCTKSARKAILIGVFVNFLAIMSGMVAITNYSDTIFVEAGSDFSPAMSSIIIGLILLIGATSSSLLSDRAGRRILMSVSSMGCGVILTLLAVYSYLKSSGYSLQSAAWVPLACLSAFMLLSSMGITSLHYLIMSEVLAQNIRGTICTLSAFENWMLAFILVKCFPLLLTAIGMEGCMLIFALVCFSGTLFVAFVLPETRGKPIEMIIKELEGN